MAEFGGQTIAVEVAYALPDKQMILAVNVPHGTTARQAVDLSGILKHFPDIDIDNSRLGIFAKPVKQDTELKAGDRVEIYRPLIADPKEVRRQRAEAGKAMKKGMREKG